MNPDVGDKLFWIPVGVGAFTLLALPAALLVQAGRPAWIDRTAEALVRQRTAVLLAGAGMFLVELFALAVLWKFAPSRPLAGLLLLAALAQFVVGFAGCATAQGRAMLPRRGCVGARPRLARTGRCVVRPVLNWPIGAYLAAGVRRSVVAWFARPKPTTSPPSARPAN